MESVKSVISDVLPALDQLLTVSHALQVKFSTKEDAGLNALPFLFNKWDKMLLAPILALTVSGKYLKLNVLLVLLNVLLAQVQPQTVLLVFTDQFQLTDHALFNVDKTNSDSKVSV